MMCSVERAENSFWGMKVWACMLVSCLASLFQPIHVPVIIVLFQWGFWKLSLWDWGIEDLPFLCLRAVSSGFFAVMEIWYSILYVACSGGRCNSMASGGCCIPTWAGLRMRKMMNLFIVHICTLQSQGHKEWKIHSVLKSRSCCECALSPWWWQRYIKLSLHLNVWQALVKRFSCLLSAFWLHIFQHLKELYPEDHHKWKNCVQ